MLVNITKVTPVTVRADSTNIRMIMLIYTAKPNVQFTLQNL